MSSRFFINGLEQGSTQENQFDVSDRAFSYGDGIFETINVVAGRIPLWKYHFQRIEKSCQKLSINVASVISEIEIFLQQIVLSDSESKTLKIIISRGCTQRGYGAPADLNANWYAFIYPPVFSKKSNVQGLDEGVLAISHVSLSSQPLLAGIKHLNRLEQVLAKQALNNTDYLDALMLDQKGNVIETIMANIFWVKENVIYIPSLNQQGVEGVVRSWLLDQCESGSLQDTHYEIGSYPLEDLLTADECFITNSLMGVKSIAGIDVFLDRENFASKKQEVRFSEFELGQKISSLFQKA